jgi:hypothetical protein
MAYMFDPESVAMCVRSGVGLPIEDALDALTAALTKLYPGQIDGGRRQWIFNNAGGAMGQIALLHASLTEYLVLFGTPIGTEGHSGRYRAEIWDFMIDGEMWCYFEGETARTVYRAGDVARLPSNACKGYRVPDRVWLLEYARGPIPTMLPFALADTLTSTLDVSALARTLGHYGRHTVRSLLRGKL